MNEYKVGDLLLMLSSLVIARRDAKHADLAKDSLSDPGQEFKNQLAIVLDGAAIMCSGIDLESSLIAQMNQLKDTLTDGTADCRPSVIEAKLGVIIECVYHNLGRRMFMYMSAEDASYWDSPKLFGENVLLLFPKAAVLEMREAGNCLAASRGTACVFHCMRVAEYGLRILARRVNVRLTDKRKPLPIEYADWNKVIEGIKSKITQARQLANGPKKEQRLQFYSDAADHCEYMKDIWRNEMAHSRRLYSRTETLAVLNRVQAFVRLFVDQGVPKDPKQYVAKVNKRLEELERSQ
jgi:hypothetical protein